MSSPHKVSDEPDSAGLSDLNMNSAEPIRLLVSDIDGTLVRDDKTLPNANRNAIVALQEAGVPTTLISARPPSGMTGLAARLGLAGPMAAFNGGTLFDPDGSIRFAYRLGEADAAWILQLVGRAGVTPWIFAQGAWFVPALDNSHLARERLASGIDPIVRSDFTGLLDRVDKIVAVSDDHGLLGRLEEQARETIGARATIARSQAHYLDFTHRRANKGDGIGALAVAFGLDLAQIAAIGDMANDVAMFARAGLAVAMGQSPAEVCAAADFTAAANEQAGVADAITRFIRPRIGRH
jgi:Cof subfamily protein (haloacid dehalogenase superfamily)